MSPWAIKPDQLKKWSKIAGFEVFNGRTVQVLFRDYGEPIGIAFLKPLNLVREDRALNCLFLMQISEKEELYIYGLYFSCLKAFVIDIPGEHTMKMLNHPDIVYLEYENRETLKDTLAKKGAREPWIRKPKSLSESDSQDWRSILSVGAAARERTERKQSEKWLPLKLAAAKLSQPGPTV